MIKKTITYVDYNGVERKETHYFDLSEAEVLEMEMTTPGGMAEMLQGAVDAKDQPALVKIFKDIISKSYGRKSPDGRLFEKSEAISREFMHTKAYSKLYMELVLDDQAASEFIKGIMPDGLAEKLAAQDNVAILPSATN